MMMSTRLPDALQFLSRLSRVQITQLHNLHIFKSKSAEEKAKAQESLSQSHHSQEGSIGKEDTIHSTQSLTGSMITLQKWSLKHLTIILFTQGEAKGLNLYQVYNFTKKITTDPLCEQPAAEGKADLRTL